MNEFWNQIVLDNPVKKYFFVFIAIVIGLLFKRIFSKFVAGQLFRAATALGKGVDKNAFVKLLLDPLEIFLIAFITIVGIDKLRFPSALEFEILRSILKIHRARVGQNNPHSSIYLAPVAHHRFYQYGGQGKRPADRGHKGSPACSFFQGFLESHHRHYRCSDGTGHGIWF